MPLLGITWRREKSFSGGGSKSPVCGVLLVATDDATKRGDHAARGAFPASPKKSWPPECKIWRVVAFHMCGVHSPHLARAQEVRDRPKNFRTPRTFFGDLCSSIWGGVARRLCGSCPLGTPGTAAQKIVGGPC